MTPSRPEYDPAPGPECAPQPGPESIGALITRVRLASGWSQLRLAELLCATAGAPTLTRNEISRWEREERIPGRRWLRCLSAVLGIPLDALERAAAVARLRRGEPPADRNPPAGPHPPTDPYLPAVTGATLTTRIAALRWMDDLVGGADLSRLAGRELAAGLRLLRADGLPERRRRQLLPAVAELAQVTCWVAADAGARGRLRRAHRVGVEAAAAAGAYPILGHLLATLAHLDAGPAEALELARRGYRLARPAASTGTRALLLHRVAFAAARTGARRDCERALAAAERAYQRRDPGTDPPWLYWFHDAELTAMTGRCYAAAGRPRTAEPLLRTALADRRIRLRAGALYAGWLAAVQLDTGEVEAACATARAALLTTVRVGSVRALRQLTSLHPRLRAARSVPAVREYAELYRSAVAYLPDRAVAHLPDRATASGGAASARSGCS
ncbi:transcriptional regulator [Planosporangium sp. 12N6]|uniref:helix-turn-helix domain-containing protein n=1 Tax=Planosporangium spinosum TaxID=3402278 RepID=UPI003CF67683